MNQSVAVTPGHSRASSWGLLHNLIMSIRPHRGLHLGIGSEDLPVGQSRAFLHTRLLHGLGLGKGMVAYS